MAKNIKQAVEVIEEIKSGKSVHQQVRFEDGSAGWFRDCIKCGQVLSYGDFHADKYMIGGRKSKCIKCLNKEHKEKQVGALLSVTEDTTKECRSCGEEKNIIEFSTDGSGYRNDCRECQRLVVIISKHNREATEKGGIGVLGRGEDSTECIRLMREMSCRWTGRTENVTLDHVIPKTQGGGSTIPNYSPMIRELNSSKGDMNVFLWMRTNRFAEIAKKYGIKPEYVEVELYRLARMNGFRTVDQYEHYTLWCMVSPEFNADVTKEALDELNLSIDREVATFKYEDVTYYRPTISEKERDMIYKIYDRLEAKKTENMAQAA